eukprot:scaffold265903_cov31-Tisochrysis_lutea.AAC.2
MASVTLSSLPISSASSVWRTPPFTISLAGKARSTAGCAFAPAARRQPAKVLGHADTTVAQPAAQLRESALKVLGIAIARVDQLQVGHAGGGATARRIDRGCRHASRRDPSDWDVNHGTVADHLRVCRQVGASPARPIVRGRVWWDLCLLAVSLQRLRCYLADGRTAVVGRAIWRIGAHMPAPSPVPFVAFVEEVIGS